MDSKPYRLAGDSLLDEIRSNVNMSLTKWSADWLSDEPEVGIVGLGKLAKTQLEDVDSVKIINYHCLSPNYDIAILHVDKIVPCFRSLIFKDMLSNELNDSKITDNIVYKLLSELASEIITNLTGKDIDSSDLTMQDVTPICHDGDGSVSVHVHIGDVNFNIVILSNCLANLYEKYYLISSKSNTSKVNIKLSEINIKRKVAVKVQLGKIDMSLDMLQGLAEGDVIRMDWPLADPAEIHFITDERLSYKATLGAKDDYKAVSITND